MKLRRCEKQILFSKTSNKRLKVRKKNAKGKNYNMRKTVAENLWFEQVKNNLTQEKAR